MAIEKLSAQKFVALNVAEWATWHVTARTAALPDGEVVVFDLVASVVPTQNLSIL